MISSAKKIVQVGLIPVRCSNCNMLFCTATAGSVISVACGRCKTHNVIEVVRPQKKLEKR